MQFRTTIDIHPLRKRIDHHKAILSLGSCFADNVAKRLARAKFPITASPTGILFNPESIADAIERFHATLGGAEPTLEVADLVVADGRYHHFDFHSALSHSNPEQAIAQMQQALTIGSRALAQSQVVIITFGTAFAYRHNDRAKIVANCHKQPHHIFTREMLSAEDIAQRYTALLHGPLQGKQVIFTISPIRHLSDGLEQNSLSKATLRVAIGKIMTECDNAEYFPSYEIVQDELRDYRFYCEDMTHPSKVAIDYVWERFSSAAFDLSTQQIAQQAEKIVAASEHRPFDATTEQHRSFCRRMLEQIAALETKWPAMQFEAEKAIFGSFL